VSAGFDACPDHSLRLQRRGDAMFCPGPIGEGEHRVTEYLRAVDGELVSLNGKGARAMRSTKGAAAPAAATPGRVRKSAVLEKVALWNGGDRYVTFSLVHKPGKNIEDAYRITWSGGLIGERKPNRGTAATAPDEELARKRWESILAEARAQGYVDRPKSNNGAGGKRVALTPFPEFRKPTRKAKQAAGRGASR
jgi:hypothetical protein